MLFYELNKILGLTGDVNPVSNPIQCNKKVL